MIIPLKNCKEASIVPFDLYHKKLRVNGLTIAWRSIKHTFTASQALSFCDALQDARVYPGQEAVCGFVIDSESVNGNTILTVSGPAMGPLTLTNAEACEICLSLARAARDSQKKRLP